MNATHVVSVLTLHPKRTLLLSTVWPSAEDLLGGCIIYVLRVIDTMVCPKMLSEMIFSGKRVGSCVPLAVWTWELGSLVPVTLEIIKASVGFAAFALESVMVEGFGVTLKLGG